MKRAINRWRLIPRWIRQTVVLCLIYAVLMIAAYWWFPWHGLDMQLAARYSVLQSRLSPQITLVDLGSYIAGNRPANQRSLAMLLTRLDGLHPNERRLILDLHFLPCEPCEGQALQARTGLVNALSRLRKDGWQLYAVELLQTDDLTGAPTGREADDGPIYATLSGAAHTRFGAHDSGVVFYRHCYSGAEFPPSSDAASWDVWSMMDVLRQGHDTSTPCDTGNLFVSIGDWSKDDYAKPNGPANAQFYTVHDSDRALPAGLRENPGAYIIVGTFENDLPFQHLNTAATANVIESLNQLHGPGFVDVPGPMLLAWALSDMIGGAGYQVKPLESGLLVFVVLCSLVTAFATAAFFLLLRRFRLRGARYLLPAISATLGLMVTALALFVAGKISIDVLSPPAVYPQVSLAYAGILLSAVLSGVRASQVPTWEDDPRAKRDWDVFLSYAHADIDWVYSHIKVPLDKVTLPNRKLNVFFDKDWDSLESGIDWLPQLTRDVMNSRFVIAIYSDSYFKQGEKGYCYHELTCAYKRWIETGDPSFLRPIMIGAPNIPQEFQRVNAVGPDKLDDIIADIVRRLTRADEEVSV
ncbi:MAG TPA: toll/interleukin-1 receptor domain-containing protein [Candidatus Baltobacteraceae bacterium]|nr:toll/interleukin-1 receptor domain-containing protein [Candidatus Baltobacteraceae bacterium]